MFPRDPETVATLKRLEKKLDTFIEKVAELITLIRKYYKGGKSK